MRKRTDACVFRNALYPDLHGQAVVLCLFVAQLALQVSTASRRADTCLEAAAPSFSTSSSFLKRASFSCSRVSRSSLRAKVKVRSHVRLFRQKQAEPHLLWSVSSCIFSMERRSREFSRSVTSSSLVTSASSSCCSAIRR
ncbi:hypothetical protein JZ751_005286 [Albula glossodonta]|uniref:Uncharacterized protein n=1 Tax=Albula glossodonta TaxID=121402 RepID=A0A8T2N5U6_9TELE|nr:hypothetical protein JZ751_005286 [Albula glossodonta]